MLRILYVEDDHDLRATICELLEADGREIVAKADGESALEAWQACHFDVVLTDISLPGMSGTELARRILAAAPRQWLVFCSGYEYHEALCKLGVHVRTIPKAFDCEQMDALLDDIARALPGVQSE